MACDLCGKTGTTLVDLKPEYQVPGVQPICPDCLTLTDNALTSMRRVANQMVQGLLKRWILTTYQRFHPAPPETVAQFHPDHDPSPDSHCNCPSCR